MTLANMRAQGVRSLWVVCELCHHEAVLNVDGYGDAVPVPAFGPRMAFSGLVLAVLSVILSWRAISLFDSPFTTRSITSRS
jgi:hypothetical protein